MADGVVAASDANWRAGTRLVAAQGSVAEMFNRTEIGWTAEEIRTYLDGTPGWQALGDRQGVAFGMMLSIAVVCVEKDREARGAA